MTRKTNITPFSRTAGAGALGFATLIVAVNLILVPAGLPLTGAETSEVIDFFSTATDSIGIASSLIPATWILSTLFAAGAVRVLWKSNRESGAAWALAGFAGVLLQNATFTGVMAMRLTLTSLDSHDTATTAALWALHDALFTLNGTFLALALVGLTIGGLRAGLVPRWHAAVGLLAALLQFSSATLAHWVIQQDSPLGLLGLSGWLLWVVWLAAYGVILFRQKAAEPATMAFK